MPWRGPQHEGELPSLGWSLLDWFAEHLPSPRDSADPLIFTDEQARLLVEWFTIEPATGRYLYRRGQSRRSKGWGKSPLEAAKCIAELAGAVVPAGWDADGEPVGRPWGTGNLPQAWVQIAAVSEDQTENTHSVVYEFLTANDGAAGDSLHIDAGLTRSYLRDGARRGKLEPVTAAAGTREGQPITYGCLDETHLWTPSNGGKRLARTIRRNVGKMDGRTYETTNSFIPGEDSVAQNTHAAYERGAPGIYVDAVEAPRIDLDNATDAEVRAALAVAYGDAWWVNLDRLVADARDPDNPREDVERFNFNWNVKGGGRAVDPKRWAQLARAAFDTDTQPAPDMQGEPPPAGTPIGLGFDGSISDDCTVLRGCTRNGYSFHIGFWARPVGAAADWRIPRLEVMDTIHRAFKTWRVGRMFADPAKWYTELELLADTYRTTATKSDDKTKPGKSAKDNSEEVEAVLVLDTNREARFAPAVDRWFTAIREGVHTHDDHAETTAHVLAMHKRKARARAEDDDGRTLYVLVKGEGGERRKIDAGIADVLAYEAAMTMPEPVDLPERTFWGAWA